MYGNEMKNLSVEIIIDIKSVKENISLTNVYSCKFRGGHYCKDSIKEEDMARAKVQRKGTTAAIKQMVIFLGPDVDAVARTC